MRTCRCRISVVDTREERSMYRRTDGWLGHKLTQVMSSHLGLCTSRESSLLSDAISEPVQQQSRADCPA
jgi:hypothetical protein